VLGLCQLLKVSVCVSIGGVIAANSSKRSLGRGLFTNGEGSISGGGSNRPTQTHQ
jgi:hypothetical protein